MTSSTTALPKPAPVLHRISTTDSSVPSSSAGASPLQSPRQSPSSTSLSSIGSSSQQQPPKPQTKLLDTYGNEFKIPDFTVNDIRRAIPPRCFERSAVMSLSYLARDLAALACIFYAFHTYVTPELIPSYWLRVALWSLYTFVQGLFGTGVWVLAHECGHQAFSTSKTLNDTVGWICHSALMVPYFSWKITHGKHHKATGNLARDMVFIPKTRPEYASRIGRTVEELSELLEESPLKSAYELILQQVLGWPAYLLANVTGHDNHESQPEGRGKGKRNGFFTGVNHFNPSSPLFSSKEAKLIVLSDIGLLLMGSVLFYIGKTFGWLNLLVWYGIPYLWVNHWLSKFGTLTLEKPEIFFFFFFFFVGMAKKRDSLTNAEL